jgi:uncharacterized membrane protein YkgB
MYAGVRSVSGRDTTIPLTCGISKDATEKQVSAGQERQRKWVVLSENETRRRKMSIGLILLIVLVLALVGVIPTWGHSSSWGYGPSGGVGTVLLIVLILVLMGKI